LAKFSGRNLITMGMLIIVQNLVFEGLSFIWEVISILLISIVGTFITLMYFSFKIAFGVSEFEI